MFDIQILVTHLLALTLNQERIIRPGMRPTHVPSICFNAVWATNISQPLLFVKTIVTNKLSLQLLFDVQKHGRQIDFIEEKITFSSRGKMSTFGWNKIALVIDRRKIRVCFVVSALNFSLFHYFSLPLNSTRIYSSPNVTIYIWPLYIIYQCQKVGGIVESTYMAGF